MSLKMNEYKEYIFYFISGIFSLLAFAYKAHHKSIANLGARIGKLENQNAVLENEIHNIDSALAELRTDSHQIAQTLADLYKTLNDMKISLTRLETGFEFIKERSTQNG
jgi:uncharacterized coiled-coil protein SlyX